MEQLIAKVRRVPQLRSVSDALLLALLANSDYLPDRVFSGVILFQRGDVVTYWYLLLSGEVELYLPSDKNVAYGGYRLRVLSAGALFGELESPQHSCSARVCRNAEFVRISHQHFLGIYSKHADHLQLYTVIMADVVNETAGAYNLSDMQKELPEPSTAFLDNSGWTGPVHLFELSNAALSVEERLREAALTLKRTMQVRNPEMIRDRQPQRLDSMEVYTYAMVGMEMTKWLGALCDSVLNSAKPLKNIQLVGMWQTLLDNGFIIHVDNEPQFKDKFTFYRWNVEDPFEDRLRQYAVSIPFGGVSAAFANGTSPSDELPTTQDLTSCLLFLSTIGPDALFRTILCKAPYERSNEELDLVYEELLHVKALSHLSTMVKRELASVIRFEEHQHAGSVLFRQGEEGHSWYIILRGSVNVSIKGKGTVCTLHEGDDFGKLALINDTPRAATVTLGEDNSQFLRVDKHDFNRILRDVEANTVRLKEHGQDVLVLEKIDMRSLTDGATSKFSYSVMAGLPEKMIEYVLETRIDAHNDDATLDVFLEDFILTHIIFMPTNTLCNFLKAYYARSSNTMARSLTSSGALPHYLETNLTVAEQLTAKRRVITFLRIWESVLGIQFFLDKVVNSFVEELYSCVLEDSKILPNLSLLVEQMSQLHYLRESAMRILSRHPVVILDCGVYCAEAPAPNPILPIDTCNQIVYLSDTTFITMSVRLDKKANEIAKLAQSKLLANSQEECLLVEVKSSGERVVYSPTEVCVPTMMSLNGRLYLVHKDEIDSLTPLLDQNGPLEAVHHSILDIMSTTDIAQQLTLFHTQLFEATDEIELVFQVTGRDQFPGRIPCNLDILIRRFNEVQYWATTEVLLAPAAKRLTIFKRLIKIAILSRQQQDLMSLFAITLGLSNISVSRLTQLWDKIPVKLRKQFAEFEALLDPSRNHRAYRMLVAKMKPPVIPFVPLILKDLTFLHEGNKTYFAGLVNFEKMHMIANALRAFRNCKNKQLVRTMPPKTTSVSQNLVRNFRVIDNQRRLMELSYQIEPTRFRK
ncbi:Protein EPAC-1 [Aphelenchoides avenae]|nr:Protein EPAC-1 [Aphelenchus avenae]